MTSNVTYVRWQRDQPRRGRVFPALAEDHPAHHAPCPLCGLPLGTDPAGKGVQLLAIGPDDDDAAYFRHHDGRWYSALAVIVHAAELEPLTDEEVERLVAELVPAQADA